MLFDFLFEAFGPSPRREVSHAGLSGDRETRGHAKAHVGHLRKIGAFAAQQLPHVGIALSEAVDVLRAGLRVNSYHALSPSRVAQQRRVAGRMALYIVAPTEATVGPEAFGPEGHTTILEKREERHSSYSPLAGQRL